MMGGTPASASASPARLGMATASPVHPLLPPDTWCRPHHGQSTSHAVAFLESGGLQPLGESAVEGGGDTRVLTSKFLIIVGTYTASSC
jgi:hypothetical protein